MKHSMKLQKLPFEQIKQGTKTIEIRLNDKKRQLLALGDEIEFALTDDTAQKIRTEVPELLHFPSFQALCEILPPEMYGNKDISEYENMYKYYSKEDEEKYGVLGIKLRYIGEVNEKPQSSHHL